MLTTECLYLYRCSIKEGVLRQPKELSRVANAYLWMCRCQKVARDYGFDSWGVSLCPLGFVVLARDGNDSTLLTEALYATRDMLVQQLNFSARYGDRDDFIEKLHGLWRVSDALMKDFCMDENHESAMLSSYRKVIRDLHLSGFKSRAQKLHPSGRKARVRRGAAGGNAVLKDEFAALESFIDKLLEG